MATNIDTTRALRGMSDLQQSREGGLLPGRQSNPGDCEPAAGRAAVTCEGLGYVIVGAEPGSVTGVWSVDPTALDQIIEQYVGGSAGP